MSQSRNKGTDNRSAKKVPASKTVEKEPTRKRTGLLVAVLVIVVIGAIAGVSIYWNQVRPFQQTLIVVDDSSINVGYFLKRTLMTGEDASVMLRILTDELLIKEGAPRYGFEASPEDVDEMLRALARGESETISDDEFEEWYRQQLNETELSDSELRDLTEILLLRARLHEYLAERVPTMAEQVHLYTILLDIEEVERIWEAGEDLADISKEVWQDKQSKEEAEDRGWFPHGVMDTIDYLAFDFSPGEVSGPLQLTEEESIYLIMASEKTVTQEGYYLFMVSEKTPAREVDEGPLQVLRARALDDWLLEEVALHKIEWHGRSNGFDSETYAWIQWQLSRMGD